MQSDSIAALVAAHQWFALAALCVALFIRLLKDDTKLPTIPARLRPWISLILGIVAGVLNKVAGGATWKDAALNAVIVGVLPIAVHELGVEALFGGKDVPLPNVVLTDAAKSKAPTVPPLPLLCLALMLAMVSGCAGSFEEARLVSHPASPPTTPDERAHCYSVDNSRIVWGGVAKASAVAAGASGLSALPLEGDLRKVAAGSAIAAGIIAAGAVWVSEQKGATWAKDCQ
jgi:hypothetical protein